VNHLTLLANVFVWIGIAFCISQSAIFSGLNLAIFSISKLRLEVEASSGNLDAVGLLARAVPVTDCACSCRSRERTIQLARTGPADANRPKFSAA
jgi:hypothetical protein